MSAGLRFLSPNCADPNGPPVPLELFLKPVDVPAAAFDAAALRLMVAGLHRYVYGLVGEDDCNGDLVGCLSHLFTTPGFPLLNCRSESCSPLPRTRGRGVGGEGETPDSCLVLPPHPNPSPPSTGERGL